MLYKAILQNRSIRFKFTFAFVSFIFVVLCLFAVLVYALLAHRIQQNTRKSLALAIEQSTQNFFDQHGRFHLHQKPNYDDEISQFVIIHIYKQQKLLYRSHHVPHLGEGYAPVLGIYREILDGKYLVYAKPFNTNSHSYIIQAFYLQSSEKKELQDLAIILLSLIAICILCGTAGAWYLSSRLLAPFRQIARDASRIGAENLDERLPYSIAKDEIGQLCITLNQLFHRLQKSFATLRKFTSNVSHELKTPLTIMRGDIEVLLRKERKPQEYCETLRYTLAEIERMSRLIQGLLLLAEAESGKQTGEIGKVSLAETISLARQNCEKLHNHEKKIAIADDIEQGVCVLGNPLWLQQIVENLLNNALQNTPADGIIAIRLRQVNTSAQLEIENTGAGIPPQHLPFIFDRFFRITQNNSANRGSGLGLAICKALAEAHQGEIAVASTPGQKTIFTLSLPLFSL